MRIVSKKTLQEFWISHADSVSAIAEWHSIAKRASWKSFSDVKKEFGSADCLPWNRVVFNIKGNKYRIVVKIHYTVGIVRVRFVGTHSEYSKINAEEI